MLKTVVNWIVLFALLILAHNSARAQKAREDKQKSAAKPLPQKLADMIAEAVKNNPDIQVSEAKLSEAAAELNRTRLQVTQKIAAFYHARETQRAQVAVAESSWKRMEDMWNKKVVTRELVESARQKLIIAKAKLAEMEAELPYLLGRQPSNKVQSSRAEALRLYLAAVWLARSQWEKVEGKHLTKSSVARPIRGSVAEKLRKALDFTLTVKMQNTTLRDVFDFLEDRVTGVSFRIVNGSGEKAMIEKISINLTLKNAVSLGAILQAIEDDVPGLRFVVREYGILVTWDSLLPPHALLVNDFWKAAAESAKQ
jgi:hypothetical protein